MVGQGFELCSEQEVEKEDGFKYLYARLKRRSLRHRPLKRDRGIRTKAREQTRYARFPLRGPSGSPGDHRMIAALDLLRYRSLQRLRLNRKIHVRAED